MYNQREKSETSHLGVFREMLTDSRSAPLSASILELVLHPPFDATSKRYCLFVCDCVTLQIASQECTLYFINYGINYVIQYSVITALK